MLYGKANILFQSQDVVNDIHGAQVLGMKGVLVKTGISSFTFFSHLIVCTLAGKYRDGDERTIDPPPHVVCENFAEAVEHILSSTKLDNGDLK